MGFENGTEILEIPFIYREIEKNAGIPLCLIPTDTTPEPGRGRKIKPRDLFEECAPIIRAESTPINKIEARELRGLIIPGGRGPLKLLSNIERAGAEGKIVRQVQDLIIGMQVRKKPIGTIGYGGALVMVALRRIENEPIITLGEDAVLTASLSSLGISPVHVGPQEVIFDPKNIIFSTAGIAPGTSIIKASEGIERLVQGIFEYKEKKK